MVGGATRSSTSPRAAILRRGWSVLFGCAMCVVLMLRYTSTPSLHVLPPAVANTRIQPNNPSQHDRVLSAEKIWSLLAEEADDGGFDRVLCGELVLDVNGQPKVRWASDIASTCSAAVSSRRRRRMLNTASLHTSSNALTQYLRFTVTAAAHHDVHAVSESALNAHGTKLRSLAMRTIAKQSPMLYHDRVHLIEQHGFRAPPLTSDIIKKPGSPLLLLRDALRRISADARDGVVDALDIPCGNHSILVSLLASPAHARRKATSTSSAIDIQESETQWLDAAQCAAGKVVVLPAPRMENLGKQSREHDYASSVYTAMQLANLSRLRVRCAVFKTHFGKGREGSTPFLLRLSHCGSAHSNGTSNRVPRTVLSRCSDLLSTNPLFFDATLKYGSKTGIYRGHQVDETDGTAVHPLIVKQFNVLQYASFEGFHLYHSAAAYYIPGINTPSVACFEPQLADSVLQLQELVSGTNLKRFVKHSAALPWGSRLEIMAQIACIFHRLHSHPNGPFAFDDNHPEQYMVDATLTSDGRRYYNVTLIDIDTLQRAELIDSRGSNDSATLPPHPLTASDERRYRTVCRCFYCRGRSNCVFINTPEGYRACGQSTGLHGDKEDPSVVAPGKQCSLGSDSWFLAQLFMFVADGSGPWEGLEHEAVQRRISTGAVPTVRSKHADFVALVTSMFTERLPPVAIVEALKGMCAGDAQCSFDSCPLVRLA